MHQHRLALIIFLCGERGGAGGYRNLELVLTVELFIKITFLKIFKYKNFVEKFFINYLQFQRKVIQKLNE